MNLILTPTLVQAFTAHLHSMERVPATVSAYRRAVNDLLVFAGDEPLNRELLIRYKHALVSRGYAPASVNAMLAAVNALLAFLNRRDLTVKPLRIQKLLFCGDRRELTRDDYGRLVDPARVFPHNLRHLFARTHYAAHRDIIRLADVSGHASINITRIYTAESGRVHARQIETLGLLIT